MMLSNTNEPRLALWKGATGIALGDLSAGPPLIALAANSACKVTAAWAWPDRAANPMWRGPAS